MIGEMCSSGGGQRIRSSYGNIHGHHTNRGHFSSNRAVSLDQYSGNNRRLSDGLPQVISDSNVFYNRQNRGSLETGPSACRLIEDLNMNATESVASQTTGQSLAYNMPRHEHPTAVGINAAAPSNGNLSPMQSTLPHVKQHCCAAAVAAAAAANNTSNGMAGNLATLESNISANKPSWKARLRQFSDYFGFSFDRNSKRCASTRSCSVRNNNANTVTAIGGKSAGVCCTISNNLQSPGMLRKYGLPTHSELMTAGRHRAYSLDVPCSNRSNTRYSSSSGGGGDSSRKSSRHDGVNTGDDNNSNNTLHSSSGAGSDMPTCMPPPIRIGSVDASDTIIVNTSGLQRVLTPSHLGEAEPSLSIDLGMASASSSDPPKI